ncbi:MAG TPA: hypothetical protein PKD41_04740 [Solidesulfovibrio sp.]|nr:hypothetical protein [Solidesulfovibrio sp.]
MRILLYAVVVLTMIIGQVALCRADYTFTDAYGQRWVVREEPRAYAVEPAEPRLIVEQWPAPAPLPPELPAFGYYWIAPAQ